MTSGVVSPASDGQGSDGSALLRVRDLKVRFRTGEGTIHAVNGLSLDLDPGETLAIVGESASGKSVTALAIMGLLPPEADIEGSVRLKGRELLGLPDGKMRPIRGRHIGMVFQDAMTSLDPVFTVGNQIVEAIRAHRKDISSKEATARAVELLDIVGIAAASKRIHDFPHEMSGGMRQRAMIAIAIANDPSILIADEPTTALDVTIQAQVMDALALAQETTGAAILLITHDLGLVASHADRVQVMYGGFTFEAGGSDEVFYRSKNPYTRGLLSAIPRADRRDERLQLIRGSPPTAVLNPVGCVFAPRCDYAQDICTEQRPALVQIGEGHVSRCHFAAAIDRLAGNQPAGPRELRDLRGSATVTDTPAPTPPVLEVTDLVKHFPVRRGFFRRVVGSVKAVNGVSLRVDRQQSLGIVGESGSGKTTLARCILRMTEPTSGSIRFLGRELTEADAATMRRLRNNLQLVFQDPYASLNPRMTVRQIVGEPLKIQGWDQTRARSRIRDLIEAVGLSTSHLNRYPHEFSGGQRQRIGIARSLALGPDLVILDEPVSALDVSVQAQVLNMLDSLQAEFDLAFIYIAHDLSVVRHVSDFVAVMYLGKIVETADSDQLYENPAHPYTQSLLSAVPVPDPINARRQQRVILKGDIPDPSELPPGCAFHTRCPIVQDRCRVETPLLEEVSPGHFASCHFALRPGETLDKALRQSSTT